MTQTPVSATTKYNSATPATIYTTPALKTALVKSVMASSLVSTQDIVTLNKVVSGVHYPIVESQKSSRLSTAGGTYWAADPGMQSVNLLDTQINLAAGEGLSISSSSTAYYKQAISLSNTDYEISNLKYLGTKYVAVGKVVSTGYGLVLTSSDGITWTKETFNYAIRITDIAYDGSTNYVVVGTGSGGYVYYSTNLSTWTQTAVSGLLDLYCLTYGNGKWVAGGISGEVAHCTTPTSWTRIAGATVGQASNINTVLTIGTKWCFGTAVKYFYSSDMSTFIFPYTTPYTTYGWGLCHDASGNVYLSAARSTNSYGTTSLYKSSNLGKTFTAVDLSGLSNKTDAPGNIGMCFQNGGIVFWPTSTPGTNLYQYRSADGITWASSSWTGAGYNQSSGTLYAKNAYGNHNASYNYMMHRHVAQKYLQLMTVAATGIVNSTTSMSFQHTETYIYFDACGYMAGCGNPNDGSWIISSACTANPSYEGHWYGASAAAGADATYTSYGWNAGAYGYPCMVIAAPGSNAYIAFSTGGYVLTTPSYSNGSFSPTNNNVRVCTDNQPIYGVASDGASATSKIVAVSAGGYLAYSTDQGVTWTRPSSTSIFGAVSYLQGMMPSPLQYNNGKWFMFNTAQMVWYSTDGLTWTSAPGPIVASKTLNSVNVFVKETGGLVYTTGTDVDVFVQGYATTISVNPSTACMQYVDSKYLIGTTSAVYESSDLVTFATVSATTKQINDITYLGNTANIAYTGSGSNILFGNGIRAGTALVLGKPETRANMLSIGYATTSILELS